MDNKFSCIICSEIWVFEFQYKLQLQQGTYIYKYVLVVNGIR